MGTTNLNVIGLSLVAFDAVRPFFCAEFKAARRALEIADGARDVHRVGRSLGFFGAETLDKIRAGRARHSVRAVDQKRHAACRGLPALPVSNTKPMLNESRL